MPFVKLLLEACINNALSINLSGSERVLTVYLLAPLHLVGHVCVAEKHMKGGEGLANFVLD